MRPARLLARRKQGRKEGRGARPHFRIPFTKVERLLCTAKCTNYLIVILRIVKLSGIYLLVRSDAQMAAHRPWTFGVSAAPSAVGSPVPPSLPQNETANASGSSRVEERGAAAAAVVPKVFRTTAKIGGFMTAADDAGPSSAKCARSSSYLGSSLPSSV